MSLPAAAWPSGIVLIMAVTSILYGRWIQPASLDDRYAAAQRDLRQQAFADLTDLGQGEHTASFEASLQAIRTLETRLVTLRGQTHEPLDQVRFDIQIARRLGELQAQELEGEPAADDRSLQNLQEACLQRALSSLSSLLTADRPIATNTVTEGVAMYLRLTSEHIELPLPREQYQASAASVEQSKDRQLLRWWSILHQTRRGLPSQPRALTSSTWQNVDSGEPVLKEAPIFSAAMELEANASPGNELTTIAAAKLDQLPVVAGDYAWLDRCGQLKLQVLAGRVASVEETLRTAAGGPETARKRLENVLLATFLSCAQSAIAETDWSDSCESMARITLGLQYRDPELSEFLYQLCRDDPTIIWTSAEKQLRATAQQPLAGGLKTLYVGLRAGKPNMVSLELLGREPDAVVDCVSDIVVGLVSSPKVDDAFLKRSAALLAQLQILAPNRSGPWYASAMVALRSGDYAAAAEAIATAADLAPEQAAIAGLATEIERLRPPDYPR